MLLSACAVVQLGYQSPYQTYKGSRVLELKSINQHHLFLTSAAQLLDPTPSYSSPNHLDRYEKLLHTTIFYLLTPGTSTITMEVWTEHKEHSVEGHTLTGTLKFMGKSIWGPHSCHDNTVRLGKALQEADWRFAMVFEPKEHSVEGHVRYISVKGWDGSVILDKLSTHDSMDSLARAVMEKIRENGPV